MITNISVLSMTSAARISVGQYHQNSQRLDVWVYATRFKLEDGQKFALIPDFDMSICKQAKKVVLIDLDWDMHYEMTYNQFKRIPVKDGVRRVNMSKLTPQG